LAWTAGTDRWRCLAKVARLSAHCADAGGSFSWPVSLNRLSVALWVLVLDKGCSSCLLQIAFGCSLSPISSLRLLSFELAPTFATYRLAQRNTAFVTVRHEKALLLYLTQHTFALYLFAEAFE